MPMHTHLRDTLGQIYTQLEDIANIDVQYLCEKGGNASFSNIRNELKEANDFSKDLISKFENQTYKIDSLETGALIEASVNRLFSALRAMQEFIESYLRDGHSSRPLNVDKVFEEKGRLIGTFREAFKDIRSALRVTQSNYILKRENLELKIGVEEDISEIYLSLFKDRAKTHKTASIRWLVSIALLTSLSTGYVICLMVRFNYDKPLFGLEDYLNFFDHVALRVILFSLIGYALHFMSRAYRFNKAQQISNEDKDVALQCFPKFMRTSIKDNPELHRAVMLQITQAIFSSKDGVYAESDSKGSLSPSTSLGLSLSKSD